MPNNNAKMKFDAEFLSRCERGIWIAADLYEAIKPRYQPMRSGDLIQVKRVLQEMKDYGFVNIGKNPTVPNGAITHDEAGVRRVRNAKGGLIVLFRTVNIVKQQGLKGGYAKALDLFNQFQTYLEGMAGNGK